MSCPNNTGSVLSIDSHGYDYGSHHPESLDPNADNGDDRHSPINTFRDEPQPDKNMSLGYGTNSTKTSKKKHKAAMKVYLETIVQALDQQPSYTQAGQAGAGQGAAGQGRAG